MAPTVCRRVGGPAMAAGCLLCGVLEMFRSKLALIAAGFVAGVALTLVTIGSAAQPVVADQAENAYMLAQTAQVAPLATRAHDDGHDLSAAVYGWLDTGAVPAGGHGH